MPTVQFTDLVRVLDKVYADGANQSRRGGREGLDVCFLLLGTPVTERLCRCYFLELFEAFVVFCDDGYIGRARVEIDAPG